MSCPKCLLPCALLTLLAHAAEPMSTAELDHQIRQTLINPAQSGFDASWVTADVWETVIARLLERQANPTGGGAAAAGDSEAETALLRLGHEETIRHLVADTLAGNLQSGLRNDATEAALPFILDAIEDASPEETTRGDIGVGAPQGMLVSAAMEIIQRSKEFPEQTGEWAENLEVGMREETHRGARIHLLLSWWEQNRANIEAKRYADAEWLPMYKDRPSVIDAEESAGIGAGRVNKHGGGQASAVASSLSDRTDVESTSNRSPAVFPWITTGSVLLVILVMSVWFHKRAKLTR